jgi:glycosidase/MoaA/NifB/PqqE/SkfB family radical SAM enzyme
MRLVRFRFRADRQSPTVEVRGEMQHWLYPAQLEPVGDGWCEHTYRLAPGTYQYKFHTLAEWVLDPANPRTRSRDGARNSLLVIDGADEPVLHAPARPYVFEEDDGRLCIRAGLRRGHGEHLELRWDEGAGVRRLGMRQVGHEDEHLLFEAHVPGAGRQLEYLFAVPGGALVGAPGGAAQAFRIARDAFRLHAPAWWRDAVLYTIFVDRFRPRGGVWADPAITSRERRAGGDLDGVAEAIPYLADLGVTALHLTPICVAPSVHRYDAVDPRRVAPELGGEAALDRVFEAAHAAGMRVLLDVAITHVHRDFFAFRDVRDRGRDSPYWSWFSIQHHPFFEGYDPGYAHYQKGQWQEPLLRTDEPEVVEYLVETFVHWARRGADGFRVDAAADVPRSVVREIGKAVRAVRRDAAIFAEYTPDNIEHWTAEAVDSATDFVAQQALYDWLWRRTATPARVAEVLARRRFSRGGPGWTAITFTATHDQPRLHTLVGDPRLARLGQLHVLLRAPVPALYYGDEVGLHSDEPSRGFEDSWPDRQCMPWDEARWDRDTHALVRAAIHLRRAHAALRRGDEEPLEVRPATSRVTDDRAASSGRGAGDAGAGATSGVTDERAASSGRGAGDGAAATSGVTDERAASSGRGAGDAGAGATSWSNDDRAGDVPDVVALRRDAGEPGPGGIPDVVAFRRRHAGEVIDVLLHAGSASCRVALPACELDGAHVLLVAGEAAVDHGEIVLGPCSAIVLARVPELPPDALDDATALSHNRLLGALAFREGATQSPAYPANLYVTITEACNLRCQHCITHAPELTRSGRARGIRPWLLDALREPFAAADYVAFAHGGESLTSPMFWDVLAAIDRARAGRPGRPDIHLLSNGMLLLADATARLIDAGVTSLMVSLDGATPETNDRIRTGGKLAKICANLRDAVRIRRERGADLRIGISTVVGATNAHELPAIARLAIELGVDWLKIEETYPATPFARKDLLKPSAAPIAEGMAAVRELCAGSGLVLVDHLDPPSGCACEAARRPDGAVLRAFRAADDFANRARFAPCRAAWEQACVDPDGTVHPIDYFHPALGNLQDAPFLELWNNPLAQRLRARVLTRIDPAIRASCNVN